MSKMNVKSIKQRKKSSTIISDEERRKRYYYNQLKKRREVIDTITSNFKEYSSCFVTLTFVDESVDIEEASRSFEKFTNNLRRTYDNFRYVATVEIQCRGTIHYHLVCNITDESDAINSIFRYWEHGEKNIQTVYDIKKLASYMTKDFIKQDDTSPLFGKRGYKKSQHLGKPFVVKSWNMAQEDFEVIKDCMLRSGSKKKVIMHHEKAGHVEYNTYKLCMNNNNLFGEYVIATRKKLQF